MKCEKCNEREANFFYTSNINGKVTRRHLCAECAAEEGLMNHDEMFANFFAPFQRSPFGLLGSFWNDDFWSDMFAPFGRLALARPDTEQAEAVPEAGDKAIPADAGAEMKSRRELAALKAQLEKAVANEDFEKAIELRDKIRALEKK